MLLCLNKQRASAHLPQHVKWHIKKHHVPVTDIGAPVPQKLLGESDFARRNDGGVVIPTPLLHLTTRYAQGTLPGSFVMGKGVLAAYSA